MEGEGAPGRHDGSEEEPRGDPLVGARRLDEEGPRRLVHTYIWKGPDACTECLYMEGAVSTRRAHDDSFTPPTTSP